jgi:hypothetical protein
MKFTDFINEAKNPEFTKNIKLLLSIENKAINTRDKLDKLRYSWDDINEEILKKFPNEWEEFCKNKGLSSDYTFGDLLA